MTSMFFDGATIKTKVIAISTMTSAIVLSIAAATVMVTEYFQERQFMEDSTAVLANVIATNIGPALAFEDPGAAAETLLSLAGQDAITSAEIYSVNGELFASYISTSPGHQSVLKEIAAGGDEFPQENIRALRVDTYLAKFRSSSLDLSVPVLVDSDPLGFITIKVDLGPLNSAFYLFSVITLACLALSFILAYLLSSWLQRSVTGPISGFAAAMIDVSESGDYSQRMKIIAQDEIGTLGTGFNIMLEKIQNRDRELETMIAELRLATQAKSTFLANMSHEIRTPMNGILGITSLLLEMRLSEKERIYTETIDQSAHSLMAIINDLLDLSKIESGQFSTEQVSFDLSQEIQDLAVLFEQPATVKGLQLSWDCTAGTPTNLRGDPGRLRQVLTNLVGNAIKFTTEGSITVGVSSNRVNSATAELLFEVIDTGIGLSELAQEHIFSAFSQADDSTTRRFGGTGLGLSICKNLVELFHGKIGVDSTVGAGSRFWFTLPFELDLESASRLGETLAEPLESAATVSTNGTDLAAFATREKSEAKVLIVDDSEVNRFIFVETMNVLGIDTVAVGGGQAAIAELATQHFDLVVMDIQMPDMDGMEATALIRLRERKVGLKKHTPIIAFSADAMEGDKERFLQAGMDDYLSKPIQHGALLLVLEKWLPDRQFGKSTINSSGVTHD